ncbi:Sec63 Brl domain-containing protein [Earliella scabrosa]|nr:Sec63 Brl domain-containing protein [Earliella scabrosa]
MSEGEGATREILLEETNNVKDLKDLLQFRFGIQHAGMSREDHGELFADGHLQVLVCTVTLPWGVNLPAHTVIIKGTQIYNPEKGLWVELLSQDLQYYLSLKNQQLPIESLFIAKLTGNLNTEIVFGTIRNRDEAFQWLGFTYLYIRMLKDPMLYSVGLEGDPSLVQERADVVHTVAALLEKCHLIKYEHSISRFCSTELAPPSDDVSLGAFRVIALSNEFKLIPLDIGEARAGEAAIPVKESIEEPEAKINVLLQAYILQLQLDGFALVADMVYVHQSYHACHLRDLLEAPAKAALDMCKMVERRIQFKGVPASIIRKAEGKQSPWYRYFDLVPQALVQPIARSLLRMDFTIIPDFRGDEKIHGTSESFWILVEDLDGEIILFHDTFQLRQRYAEDERYVTLTVPISELVPPNFYISHLLLREKFPPPTPLLDLQALPLSALHNKEFEAIYSSTIQTFNKIQTQVFQALYNTDETSSSHERKRTVCIEPYKEMVDQRVEEWRSFVSSKGDLIVCTPTQWDVLFRGWRHRKNTQTIDSIPDEVQTSTKSSWWMVYRLSTHMLHDYFFAEIADKMVENKQDAMDIRPLQEEPSAHPWQAAVLAQTGEGVSRCGP